MKYTQQSIGRDAAIALHDTKWWENRTDREIAEFQMLTEEACMPFDVFQLALEKALGRPVFTHELALNFDGLMGELFDGKPAPSLSEIVNLIPAEKQIVVKV